MKKIFSLLAIIIFTTSIMSVAPTTKTIEEDGRASDCVRMARATVLALANHNGVDPNAPQYFRSYLSLYFDLYTDCLNN